MYINVYTYSGVQTDKKVPNNLLKKVKLRTAEILKTQRQRKVSLMVIKW